MKTEIERIASLLKQTFEGKAWHGPSLKESLENITHEEALKKLPNTHSIIELVSHITTWRIYITRKLEGQLDYKVTDELNFPRGQNWNKVLEQLEESQNNLLSVLEKLQVDKLFEIAPDTDPPRDYYALLHGIIHHDVYHAGQIGLIRKETREQTL